MRLFLAPHSDDEVLFGSWTIMREGLSVAVVFDSFAQPLRGGKGCDAVTRRRETQAALVELGSARVEFLGLPDTLPDSPEAEAKLVSLLASMDADRVWAPAEETDGHAQHNLVARAALRAFGDRIVDCYLTYTRAGGKSRSTREVAIESGDWIGRKLRALACYKSQLQIDPRLGCWPHFVGDLREYYAE